jgi:2-haloacid dehalogenase
MGNLFDPFNEIRNMQFKEWITFDCYGTLIDWESGIINAITPILHSHGIKLDGETILRLYAEIEPLCEAGDFKPYREVLTAVMDEMGKRLGFVPTTEERLGLVNSIGNWPPFPDTIGALKKLQGSSLLGVISNVDDDLFEQTSKALGIKFSEVVTALQVGFYKPSMEVFEFARMKMEVSPIKWMHVAQSRYHDIAPASQMGITTVWINRRSGKAGEGAVPSANVTADYEFPDMKSFVDWMLR